jgi:hypothetical protein
MDLAWTARTRMACENDSGRTQDGRDEVKPPNFPTARSSELTVEGGVF